MSFAAAIHSKAVDLVRASIRAAAASGAGYPSSAASLAHLVAVLMYRHLRYDPGDPGRRDADRLVLSEAHARAVVEAAAADLGIAAPPPGAQPFVPSVSGGPGQGLSVAAGLALAARLDGLGSRVFCIVGDAESREGQVWEAIDFIVDHRVTAVCPLFNCNGYGQSGEVSAQQSPDAIAAKLVAAGLEVAVIDGHDPDRILEALARHADIAASPGLPPFAIVARTVKGWGVPALQGPGRHGRPLIGDDDLARAMADLEATAKGLVGPNAAALRIESPRSSRPGSAAERRPPTFDGAAALFGLDRALKRETMSTRQAFGIALRALGHARQDVVALDDDVRNATYSEMFYDDVDLRPRFFQCHVAEQHMLSCALGMAAGGKVPFVASIGTFLARAYDQIETAVVCGAAVKLVGTYAGVPECSGLADVAFLRALTTLRDANGSPLLYVLQPADARQAYALTLAMAAHRGSCYLRTTRPEVPFVHGADDRFELGGHSVLREGRDLLIAASGPMLHEALRAAATLERDGVRATVLDLYSLPFDADTVAGLARGCHGRVVTVEDGCGAGLGSAVAEALAERGGGFTIRRMRVQRVPRPARTPGETLEGLGLSADDIVRGSRAVVGANDS